MKQLIVGINKMDDANVNWSKDRYEEISKEVGASKDEKRLPEFPHMLGPCPKLGICVFSLGIVTVYTCEHVFPILARRHIRTFA